MWLTSPSHRQTSGDIPYPNIPIAAARDKEIRRGVVVQAENKTSVALEMLRRQALSSLGA